MHIFDSMKYSIILPVRNGGELIKECVQSILNQTYTYFDLLILDSGSTDDTLTYIRTLKDSRIKLFLSEKPLSIEESWNRIVHIKKNEFISLIGHDDILFPDYLKTIDELINANPRASLYQTHFNFIDAFGNTKRECKPMPVLMQPNEFIEKALKMEIDLNGTGYVCRASDYDKIDGIPLYPNLMFADYALWFSVIANGPVVVSDSFQFAYRLHQNTSQVTNVITYMNALKDFVQFLKTKTRSEAYQKSIQKFSPEFIAFYCRSISHKMLRVKLEKRNGIKVHDFVKRCKIYCKEISDDSTKKLFRILSLQIAVFIDSNFITRFLFRKFKSFYSKPILNNL